MTHDNSSSTGIDVPSTAAYEAALRFLCRPVSKATYPGDLAPLKDLLARLGNSQRRFRSVIVTGSVGKGTVAHLLAASLHQAGIHAGLFSGPHLHTYRERIAVDGQLISKAALVEQVGRIRPHVEALPEPLSTFELAVALAFDWFAQQGVEVAVLEVGIGGRYDAVNVASAESALIMPTELEHTVLLGDTLADVAHHKAGVIPADGFAVIAPQPHEARKVIEATCRQRNTTALYLAEDARWQAQPDGAYRVVVSGHRLSGETPLMGEHNALNIAAVVAWAQLAAGRGYGVTADHVAAAATRLRMPGRVELARRGGTTLLIDGAHTPGGAAALAGTLESLARSGPLTYVVGMARDKNVRSFLTDLRIPAEARLVLTSYKSHRAMPVNELAAHATQAGLDAIRQPSFSNALAEAMSRHDDAGLIVVTGALQLAAQTREWLGLLDSNALAEAQLTRAIFSGPSYMAQVEKPARSQVTR